MRDRADEAMLRLFVYGTLERGQVAHEQLCGGARSIEPAVAAGRLYMGSAGYPMLAVPPARILATGGSDPRRDAATTAGISEELRAPPARETVHGELMTFDENGGRLASLDAYEGFCPGRRSLYLRVLIAVRSGDWTTAWTYVLADARRAGPLTRIATGRWPPA